MHDALCARLCAHFALPAPDDDLLRLALSLAGLGVHLHVGRDVNDQLAPGLMDGPAAIDTWTERLVHFGLAMVRAEAERRGAHALDVTPPAPLAPLAPLAPAHACTPTAPVPNPTDDTGR
jgi:hypothetical protein